MGCCYLQFPAGITSTRIKTGKENIKYITAFTPKKYAHQVYLTHLPTSHFLAFDGILALLVVCFIIYLIIPIDR